MRKELKNFFKWWNRVVYVDMFIKKREGEMKYL